MNLKAETDTPASHAEDIVSNLKPKLPTDLPINGIDIYKETRQPIITDNVVAQNAVKAEVHDVKLDQEPVVVIDTINLNIDHMSEVIENTVVETDVPTNEKSVILPEVVVGDLDECHEKTGANSIISSDALDSTLHEYMHHPELPLNGLPTIEAITERLENKEYGFDVNVTNEVVSNIADLDIGQSREVEDTFIRIDACLAVIDDEEHTDVALAAEAQEMLEELVDLLATQLGIDISDDEKRSCFHEIIRTLAVQVVRSSDKHDIVDRGTHESIMDEQAHPSIASQVLFSQIVPIHHWLGWSVIRLAMV